MVFDSKTGEAIDPRDIVTSTTDDPEGWLLNFPSEGGELGPLFAGFDFGDIEARAYAHAVGSIGDVQVFNRPFLPLGRDDILIDETHMMKIDPSGYEPGRYKFRDTKPKHRLKYKGSKAARRAGRKGKRT